MRRIALTVQQLAEHFETVQIFTTNFDNDIGTTSLNYGAGNWHARRGQVREWSLRQDENVKIDVHQTDEGAE